MIINLEKVLKEKNLKVDGILHLGACLGEEKPIYDKITPNVWWVEANKYLIPIIEKNVFPQKVYNYAICDVDDEWRNFNIIYSDDRTNPGCSSLLELKEHAVLYPMIKKVGQTIVKTKTIDTLVKEEKIKINAINMDLQGSELIALKGAVETLKNIDIIYTEFAIKELYEECCLLKDLDNFLHEYERIETEFAHPTWGDAVYVRRVI